MQTVIVLGVLLMVLSISVATLCSSATRSAPGPNGQGHVCAHWLEAIDASHGIRECFLVFTASSQISRERKQKNDIICLQETHGKDEFLQSIQVPHTQFRMFDSFVQDKVNAGGSAIFIHQNVPPDHAIVSHEITCPGATLSP